MVTVHLSTGRDRTTIRQPTRKNKAIATTSGTWKSTCRRWANARFDFCTSELRFVVTTILSLALGEYLFKGFILDY